MSELNDGDQDEIRDGLVSEIVRDLRSWKRSRKRYRSVSRCQTVYVSSRHPLDGQLVRATKGDLKTGLRTNAR